MSADEASDGRWPSARVVAWRLVSDDFSLLGTNERALLDEVIALGRANDTADRVR